MVTLILPMVNEKTAMDRNYQQHGVYKYSVLSTWNCIHGMRNRRQEVGITY